MQPGAVVTADKGAEVNYDENKMQRMERAVAGIF
jgi:hypothetical protein